MEISIQQIDFNCQNNIIKSTIKAPVLILVDPKYPYGKTKDGKRKCVHGVRDYICKQCPGKGICVHNKLRSSCKECGGGSICEHNRSRSECKECKGGSICEHNKRKSRCKECGGNAFCEHNKRKERCNECGGSAICEHGRQRYSCKECGGSAFCEHGKWKYRCKDCGGAGICEHDKRKDKCKECNGVGICEHGKQKHICKDCKGVSICEHNNVRYKCKNCRRNLPLEYVLSRYKNACIICGAETKTPKQQLHKMCSDCMNPNEKRPEICWREIIEKNFEFKPSTIDENVYVKNCNDEKYRPDLSFHTPDLVIILEFDEHSHGRYSIECELKRTVNMKDAYPDQKILMIRMNPDINNEIPEELVSLESRTCYMLEVMEQYLDTEGELYQELDDGITNVIYLFYGKGGEKHILASNKNPESVKVIDTHYC